MSDLEGVMLSEYFLLQCIRRGGVADVYRARQNGEDSYEVAVKVYRPGYAQRDSFREYFMAEAEKIGQFDHPNILPFLEFGEGEGLLYTVTPLTPLPSLSTSLIGADPQTPVPAHFALSSSSRARATTRVPSPRYTTPASTETPQQPSTVTNGGSENAENRQKDVLGENSVASKPRFWTVDPDPVEWSPITRAKVNLIPLNADAYLSNQSVVIGPEVQSPAPAPQSAEKEGEHTEEKAESALAARLRKLLPVVVVILLLLGLLGALLSSFYFP